MLRGEEEKKEEIGEEREKERRHIFLRDKKYAHGVEVVSGGGGAAIQLLIPS